MRSGLDRAPSCYSVGVHALVKGAVVAAGLSLLGVAASRGRSVEPANGPATAAPSELQAPAVLTQMPCPPRHLPEGQACIPLPNLGAPINESDPTVQRERSARGVAHDLIPRKPDRDADPFSFAYPLEDEPLFLRGFDEAFATDASPVSLELAAERGTTVRALALDGQQGPARVVAVGRLVGTTVITRHDVLEADRTRTYLLVHGHLDATATDLKVGTELAGGDAVGFVGDSGNPGIVSLYFETRVVRDGIEMESLPIERIVDAASSIPSDARNVLPLR